MPPTALSRWAGPAAILGGALWVPYGVFEMLEPWGAATFYREDLGYQLITDTGLFVAYSLPGSLALLLTSTALLRVATRFRQPVTRLGGAGLILASIAVGLALLSLAGVIVLFAPLSFGGLVFGSLALGVATVLAGIDARRLGAPRGWTVALLALGLVGLFLLPLRPLVYALGLLSTAVGAAIIALFGVGWVALGCALLTSDRQPRRIAPADGAEAPEPTRPVQE